jgi:hypothetical protein
MRIKTAEAKDAALDWLVAIAEGFKPEQLYINKWSKGSPASIYTRTFDDDGNPYGYMTGPDRLYSHKWEAGGPIIEREWLDITPWPNESDEELQWQCKQHDSIDCVAFGPTPLIAAMRCYVASKLGDEVEIPKELLT